MVVARVKEGKIIQQNDIERRAEDEQAPKY